MGTGATAAGGASLLGSGAFTSVAAEREISVAVADDTDAFLRLAPCPDSPNGGYVDNSNGQLSIDLSGENSNDDPSGSGVNTNALSRFDSVFEIANQGTQDVCVDFAVEVPRIPDGANVPEGYDFGPGDPAVVFYRGSDRGRYVINNRLDTDRDGAIKLPIDNGSSECIGFEVRAFGFETGENLFGGVDLTIRADADAECTVPEEGDVADPTPTGPTDGLVGYWPLNNINNGSVQELINGYTGSVQEGVLTGSGKIGGAAKFEGEDAYISIDSGPDVSESFSIAAWVNANNINHTEYPLAVSKWQRGVNRDYLIGVFNDGRLYSQFNSEPDGNKTTIFGPEVSLSTWYHCVLVYDGTGGMFYVDGTSRGQKDGKFDNTSSNIVIGSKDGGGNPWNGLVDDVRIYNRALSESEIQRLYDATSGE